MRNIVAEKILNCFIENRYFLGNISVIEFFFPIEVATCSSDKFSICFPIMPNVSRIGWWIRDHQIEFSKDYLMMTVRMKRWVNTWFYYQIWLRFKYYKSIHEEEFSNKWVGSLINRYNPNCEVINSIVFPSKLVLSSLYQLLYFPLKFPMVVIRNGFFWARISEVISKLSEKFWNSSWGSWGSIKNYQVAGFITSLMFKG